MQTGEIKTSIIPMLFNKLITIERISKVRVPRIGSTAIFSQTFCLLKILILGQAYTLPLERKRILMEQMLDGVHKLLLQKSTIKVVKQIHIKRKRNNCPHKFSISLIILDINLLTKEFMILIT